MWTIIKKCCVQRTNGVVFMAAASTSTHVQSLCKISEPSWVHLLGILMILLHKQLFNCILLILSWSKPDWETLSGLTLRRLTLEVLMGGGKVSNNLAHASHFILLSALGDRMDFDFLMKRYLQFRVVVLLDQDA